MLPLYKKILIPTDFSENSNLAFRHAVIVGQTKRRQDLPSPCYSPH